MNLAVAKAFEVGDAIAEKLGFYVVDAQLVNENGQKILRVFIDKAGGVGLDDCEVFNNEFEPMYDKADPIKEPYILEISSPGADRTLKTERELKYYIGRNVDVKLYASVGGLKEFDGILESYDGGNVTVKVGENSVSFNQKEAVYIKLTFKM